MNIIVNNALLRYNTRKLEKTEDTVQNALIVINNYMKKIKATKYSNKWRVEIINGLFVNDREAVLKLISQEKLIVYRNDDEIYATDEHNVL